MRRPVPTLLELALGQAEHLGASLDEGLGALGYSPGSHGRNVAVLWTLSLHKIAIGEAPAAEALDAVRVILRLRSPSLDATYLDANAARIRADQHTGQGLPRILQMALARYYLERGEPLYLAEVAALLGVTPQAIHNRVVRGSLPVRKVGRSAALVSAEVARVLLAAEEAP